MGDRHSRGSSSALSSISEDEGAAPSSPSTVSENDDSTLPDPAMPPAKKRKISSRPLRPASLLADDSPTLQPRVLPGDFSDVSSDTSGSVPPSPRPHPAGQPATVDEAGLGAEQVRVCAWDGCDAGDLGDQDRLITHINDIHIGQKGPKAKYPCEWIDCKTKGKQHGSAYSLRNHVKSHTKERAHYCSLPECDRSFTRSDALHKHMRTVHESESFRTAEHYPKQKAQPTTSAAAPASPVSVASPAPPPSTGDPNVSQDDPSKCGLPTKITLKLGGREETKEPMSPASRAEICPVAAGDGFTPDEAAMPRDALLQLLRRQLKWAREDNVNLMREVHEGEARRKDEWLDKELILENVLEAEIMGGLEKGTMKNDVFIEGRRRQMDDEDLDIAVRLPLKGDKMPWYRNASHLRKPRQPDDLLDISVEPNGVGPLKGSFRSEEKLQAEAEAVNGENEDADRDMDMDRDSS